MDEVQMVVAAVATNEIGQFLVAQRSRPEELAGKWEFPGGKIEAGEGPEDALARELMEELGMDVVIGDRVLGPADGDWPISAELVLRVFQCTATTDAEAGDDHLAVQWVDADALVDLDWVPADRPIAELVAQTASA